MVQFRLPAAMIGTIFMLFVMTACDASSGQALNVYAASSLTDAFTEIAAAFEEANPDVEIRLNFGGSSALAAQILEGAPAGVFASANPAQMERLADAGLLASDARLFATNRLTVIVPVENPARIESLSDLANPGVRLVLAAPGVPVREYTLMSLERMAASSVFPETFNEIVLDNLVSDEDNVRQVVLKVALGEADAGVVYTSDVTPDVADQLLTFSIPDAYNVIASYPAAVIEEFSSDAAYAFIDFILSQTGQQILVSHGLGPAD
jgi:molybdate transport system substrate-binding protein